MIFDKRKSTAETALAIEGHRSEEGRKHPTGNGGETYNVLDQHYYNVKKSEKQGDIWENYW
ncbi:hypothetical protein LQE96_04490 [Phocea massiliensis]|jgi:hypothetical protein|uniref:hypothetical protein n=1 Tax=Merdimmobilis hominis TaxID=2897707 RepID=UPI00116098FA|nr:hypothetical protein [Merdimmobilis hominis]MCD4836091.1 hypothetical protein [Merdimmobilis hominis]